MTIRAGAVAAALIASASPAAADVTATYINLRGFETVVEVTDSGLARIGQTRREEGEGPPDFSIFRPEGDFFVFTDKDEKKVVSWAVFKHVIENSMLGIPPVPAMTEQQKKRAEGKVPLPPMVGKVTVEGRPGTAYLGSGKTTWKQHHWIVISADPKLRPLAYAFLRFFRSRPEYFEYYTHEADPQLHELAQLMAKGAPLEFGDLQLLSVNFDRIDEGRFKLPAKPLTFDEYRKIVGFVTIGPAGAAIKPGTKP